MRLYHWFDPQDRILLTARIADPAGSGDRRTLTGVPLSVDPPHAGDQAPAIDIPREIVEPFRIRSGRYLVPASVVRAYQRLREQS